MEDCLYLYEGKKYTKEELTDLLGQDKSFLQKLKDDKRLDIENRNLKNKINIWAGSNENTILSNLAIRPFEYQGEKYNSVEEFYQLQKRNYLKNSLYENDLFGQNGLKDIEEYNQKIADEIIKNQNNTFRVKQLGMQFKEIDTKSWDINALNEMKRVLKISFEQNPEALKVLLSTGNSELTHNQDKGRWKKDFPNLLMEIRNELLKDNNIEPQKTKVNGINFLEESSIGYKNRTIKNASADATIAIAVDFNSAGEKLTKSSVLNQGKKYISIDANKLEVTQERVDRIVEQLNSISPKKDIYSQLENKTQSENVVIDEVKGRKPAVESDVEVKGINIRSDKTSPNSLSNRLTNPNWYAKELFDVESAYKANASKIKAPELNAEEALKYDMNLMYQLQLKKFRQNPELIDEINEQGGLEFIKQSSHIVGVKNSRWEGKGLKSNFIKVLAKSYETVSKELGKFVENQSSKPIVAYRTRGNNFLEALEKDNAIGNPWSHLGSSLNIITPNDKIIFGHPAIGKTEAKKLGKDFIDVDEDYKEEHTMQKILRNHAKNTGKKEDLKIWEDYVTTWWNKVKSDAKKSGKRIFVSNLPILRMFPNDFDKVINISKETFVNRSKQRNDYKQGETEEWKQSLDEAISKIDKSKIVNTDKYLSDLLDSKNQYGLYKTNTVKEAVEEFIAWMIGEKHTDKLQDYRQAIIDRIPEMRAKEILYYKDLKEPSHATALDYLINKYDWNNKPKQGVSLNIAGNGIYTMKGKYTQQQVDDFTYQLLKAVIESPNLKTKIESIRTGGQTGFDEAGAKASLKLNIPTLILAPKGWAFRDINGKDIFNEQQFKERFGNFNVQQDLFNSNIVDIGDKQKSILKRIADEYFKGKDVSDIFISLQNLQQLIKGFKGSFTEAESFITSLNKLGYSINNDFTDIVKNNNETDKFYKNYVKTNEVVSGLDNLLSDKFLRQSIKTAIELIKISKGFFISQSDFARKTNENTASLFKDHINTKSDFKDNLRKNQLAYWTVTAYKNAMKNTEDKLPHVKDFLLTPLSEIKDDDTKKYNDLQSKFLQIISYDRNNGKKNDFVDILQLDNIDYVKKQSALYGNRLHLFTADSRNIKDPDKISRLISGFNELYFAKNNNINLDNTEDAEEIKINNLKTEFAKDIFKYLVLKDALLFQNQSFIKAIDPILFLETSNMLDKVQELFKKSNPSQSEFIRLFGMTKEELDLDFITKFGLHSDNYFDLNSQKLAVILTNRDEIKKKTEGDTTIDNADKGDESNNEISDTLIKEDSFPLYWDNVEKTLTVNIFAGQTSQMNSEDKTKIKKENKKFILRKENEIFKAIPTLFTDSNGQQHSYPKIGLPIITYVTKKEGNSVVRIPLKLAIVQDTVKVDNIYVTFQANTNGKLTRVDNRTMQNFKDNGIYFGDLQKYTIFDISENAYKLDLRTDKTKIPLLISIANKIKENYKGGFITGTKAKYAEHVILGTNKLSSLTDDLESQLEIKQKVSTEPIKLGMFNRKDNTLTEEKQRKILVDEINKITGKSLAVESFSDVPTNQINDILKTQMKIKDSSLTEKQIEDKIKECFKIK